MKQVIWIGEKRNVGKTLYLECQSGISGDMMVAALLDLGADFEALKKVLSTVQADGYEVKKSRVKKAGISCMDFDVVLDAMHENHDHDMEYLHGEQGHHHEHSHEHIHEHGHDHEHHHDHEHVHDHESSHEHHHEHSHEHSHEHGYEHHHEHRGMKEITEIIDGTQMSERAKKTAHRIFYIIAEAEARAHDLPMEEVHFHEVGAIDSIIDIISVAVCLDQLDITEVIVPELCEGTGTVRCQHGILPIPVPAVANIVSAYHLPIKITKVEGELITPTGAAIVAAVRTGDKLPDLMQIQTIGYGAGKRNYSRPSILRAMLVEGQDDESTDSVDQNGRFNMESLVQMKKDIDQSDCIYKLETNIDDSTGEELGAVMEALFCAGARDVFYTPVYMKKNRPGYQLNVICGAEDVETLEQIIFRGTTTIGIRRSKWERTILPREIIEVETPFGMAKVKKCLLGEQVRFYPEYECVLEISRREKKSYREIYQMVAECCNR